MGCSPPFISLLRFEFSILKFQDSINLAAFIKTTYGTTYMGFKTPETLSFIGLLLAPYGLKKRLQVIDLQVFVLHFSQ